MEDHISSLERLLFLTIRLFFFTFSSSIPYCGHLVLHLVRLSSCDNCRFFLFCHWLARQGWRELPIDQSNVASKYCPWNSRYTHSERAHTFLLLCCTKEAVSEKEWPLSLDKCYQWFISSGLVHLWPLFASALLRRSMIIILIAVCLSSAQCDSFISSWFGLQCDDYCLSFGGSFLHQSNVWLNN